jgi:DNA-binding NarL/FixJ family response regulator
MFTAPASNDEKMGGAAPGEHAVSEGVPEAATVLIVEDDFLVAADAESALAEAGFHVVGPANSAAEAVALAMQHRPALVLMDIRLIGTRDGIDAAIDILDRTGARCIFATAHHTGDIRGRADRAHPLGWLPKPYSPGALVREVRAALATLKS